MQRFSSRFVSLVVPAGFLFLLAAASACGGEEGDDELDAGTRRDGGRRLDAAASSSSSSSGDPFGSSSGESSSSSSSSGGSSSSSSSGSSSGAFCNDPDDAGDMLSPEPLPTLADSDDATYSVSGVMSSLDDEDTYQFAGKDTASGFLVPLVSTTAVNVQLCAFLSCDNGTLENVKCKNGSVLENYSATMIGCCGQSIKIDYECKGVSTDNVQVYMRLRSTAEQCEAYTINYSL